MKTEDIDRKIGMPDVEQEWTRFEREVIDAPRLNRQPHRWLRQAAAIAVICVVGGLAWATSHYLLHPASDTRPSAVTDAPTEALPTSSEPAATEVDASSCYDADHNTFEFDDAELQTIALCLQQVYGIEPVFVSEEARHVRFYVSIPSDKSLSEIVALLNNFQHVQMQLEGNQLIIR